MKNLVVYMQQFTITTKEWDRPCRKKGKKWVFVETRNLVPLFVDKHTVFPRGAIYRMKKHMERMKTTDHRAIWNCKLTVENAKGYQVYYLTCKRIAKAKA